ncbi:hypothetical protein [Streptomyces sp. NPDC085460]|uniref:hypothetical protein n=1 Tax=unclassified Streptomyces TaxID=2593676 RepID=UPI0037D24DEC
MTVSIIHALLRLFSEAFPPGSRHGRTDAPAPASVRPADKARPKPVRETAARPRSPYGLPETFDGEGTALVRPYLVAHERQEEGARQRWRRACLVLAADFGVDLDTRDVHAVGVMAW